MEEFFQAKCIAIVFVFSLVAGIVVGFVLGTMNCHEQHFTPALTECEVKLPRNQSCEIVITAKPIEGEK